MRLANGRIALGEALLVELGVGVTAGTVRALHFAGDRDLDVDPIVVLEVLVDLAGIVRAEVQALRCAPCVARVLLPVGTRALYRRLGCHSATCPTRAHRYSPGCPGVRRAPSCVPCPPACR